MDVVGNNNTNNILTSLPNEIIAYIMTLLLYNDNDLFAFNLTHKRAYTIWKANRFALFKQHPNLCIHELHNHDHKAKSSVCIKTFSYGTIVSIDRYKNREHIESKIFTNGRLNEYNIFVRLTKFKQYHSINAIRCDEYVKVIRLAQYCNRLFREEIVIYKKDIKLVSITIPRSGSDCDWSKPIYFNMIISNDIDILSGEVYVNIQDANLSIRRYRIFNILDLACYQSLFYEYSSYKEYSNLLIKYKY